MTDFGGRAGLMLSRTTIVTATVTGLVLVATVVGVTALSDDTPDAVPGLALYFVVSYFIAHFAMEGYSDEWRRAGRAIPPRQVGLVALRYMALSLVLFLPLLLAAPWAEIAASITTPTTTAALLLAYVLVCFIAPPALLIVSVSAGSWGDLVSVNHWRSRFGGRGDDLFLIYVVFAGALLCVAVLGLPIISFAGTISVEALTVTGGAVAIFATGFSVSLLGRLCGSFAVVPAGESVEDAQPPTLHPLLRKLQPSEIGRSATDPGGPARKTVLLEASTRVEALRHTHRGDAAALVSALRELEEAFLPHPAVGQALVLALIAAGRAQEAGAAATTAVPLCMRSGSVSAAAVIYEALLVAGISPDLSKDQMLSIGEALKGMRRVDAALDAYARVLRQEPNDMRAVKGTIAIAHDLALQKETAAQAVRVYDDLIVSCPGSTLLDFIKTERAKAIKKAQP